MTTETIEWDEEVTLEVTVRVRAKANPDYFEGVLGREPWQLAANALSTRSNPENIDGFADLTGEVYLIDVDRGI